MTSQIGPIAEISSAAGNFPNPNAILVLSREALAAYAPVPSAAPASSWQLFESAHSLAEGLRVSAVSDTACARSFSDAQEALMLPPEFPLLGTVDKIR